MTYEYVRTVRTPRTRPISRKCVPQTNTFAHAQVSRKQLTAGVFKCLDSRSTHPPLLSLSREHSDASRGKGRPRSPHGRHRDATTVGVRALSPRGVRRPRAPDGMHSAEVHAIGLARGVRAGCVRSDV